MFNFNSMKRQISIFLGFLICLSCKKSPPLPPPAPLDCSDFYSHLTSDISKVDFKPGTYWVLYDSIKGVFDSVSVVFNQQYVQEYPWVKNEDCQRKSDVIVHLLNEYIYSATGSPSLTTKGEFASMNSSSDRVLLQNFGNINCSQYNNCGTYVYFDYQTANTAWNADLINKPDSVLIYNKYFKRVINYEYPKNFVPSSGKKMYFFNSDVGFLKIKLFDTSNVLISNEVLIRYKIVK